MNDNNNNPNSKTGSLGRSRATTNLEQLPPAKKRDLRTGNLKRSDTQALDQSFPPEPVVKEEPTHRIEEDTAKLKTTEVEAARITTNHQVIKEPVAPAPQPPVQQTPVQQTTAPQTSSPQAEPKKNILTAPINEQLNLPNPVVEIPMVKADLTQPTSQTEAVSVEDVAKYAAASAPKTEYVSEPVAHQPTPEDVKIFSIYEPPPPEVKTTSGKVKAALVFVVPVIILVLAAAAIFLYVPALRERLPASVQAKLGYKIVETFPQVSVQEYRVIHDDKAMTATISGLVTNLSKETYGPIQIEMVLFRREDVNKTETKIVPIEPAQLGPNQEGKYSFTISAKDFQQTKVSKILNGEAALRVKKLGIVDPKPQVDPTQYPFNQANSNQGNPSDPNKVYDGSVTFK